jgi:phage tail-like protein
MAERAQTGTWVDPYRGYNFKLEVQGVVEGHFAECTGIGIKVNAYSYREGGNSQVTHRVPGAVEYADVTLRYGLTASKELWTWFTKIVKGTVDRRNISIVVLDSDGQSEGARWNLINAWPAQWSGAPLNASGNEVAIESMTFVFESIERD